MPMLIPCSLEAEPVGEGLVRTLEAVVKVGIPEGIITGVGVDCAEPLLSIRIHSE